jgi:hypothetical protein
VGGWRQLATDPTLLANKLNSLKKASV